MDNSSILADQDSGNHDDHDLTSTQLMPKYSVRKAAQIIRTLCCIQPVVHSSRMPCEEEERDGQRLAMSKPELWAGSLSAAWHKRENAPLPLQVVLRVYNRHAASSLPIVPQAQVMHKESWVPQHTCIHHRVTRLSFLPRPQVCCCLVLWRPLHGSVVCADGLHSHGGPVV